MTLPHLAFALKSLRLRQTVGAALAGLAILPSPLAAQVQPVSGTVVSQPVVQKLPSEKGLGLNAALARVAQNPRDPDALVEAGKAALAMGDVDAALGFFTRADQVQPNSVRIRALMAGAYVRNQNPFDAIPMFDEAEKAGPLDIAMIPERGLAYDLVGDNLAAQRYYVAALATGPNDEISRRLALSYALSGDKVKAEQVLAPLVARQDRAALRTRAFSLAILGETESAVSIAYSSLPQELAAAISPYLRYMPRLTPAQQAAAANFGNFPRAADIGRDDPRVAKFAPVRQRPVVLAAADTALIPKGQPLGRTGRDRGRTQNGRPARGRVQQAAVDNRLAPPDIQPGRDIGDAPKADGKVVQAIQPVQPALVMADAGKAPPLDPPPLAVGIKTPDQPAPLILPAQPPRVVAAAEPAKVDPVPVAVPVEPAKVAPGMALLEPALAKVVAMQGPVLVGPVDSQPKVAVPLAPEPAILVPADPKPVAEPVAPAQPRPDLASAFADLAAPSADAAPAAGAVDIRVIRPAREQPRVDPAKADGAAKVVKVTKPVQPAHPSRIWVQVATGRDKQGLAFDWRRMARQGTDAFRGKQGHISGWGQTNRLLAGPFPTEAAANAFIAQLRRADIDGAFVWTSPAGQVVDDLPGR